MNAGIGVNEDTFGSETLGAVTGDGVAAIEIAMLAGVELDVPVVVEAGGKAPVGMNCLDDGEVAVSNAERFVGCRYWMRPPTENSRSFSR